MAHILFSSHLVVMKDRKKQPVADAIYRLSERKTLGVLYDRQRHLSSRRCLRSDQEPASVELPAEFGADGSLRLTKFGRLDKLADWIAACQRREIPNIDTTTVALFAGSHGLAKYSVSMSEAGATERRVKALQEGKMATNGLAAQADATVRVFELALEVPTKDIAIEPAMSEQECASTIAFGMEAVTDKPDCLTLGMIGVGGGTAAAAVASALYGGDSQYWVRAGRGVPEEINLAREGIVNAAIKRAPGPSHTIRSKSSAVSAARELAAYGRRHHCRPTSGYTCCARRVCDGRGRRCAARHRPYTPLTMWSQVSKPTARRTRPSWSAST